MANLPPPRVSFKGRLQLHLIYLRKERQRFRPPTALLTARDGRIERAHFHLHLGNRTLKSTVSRSTMRVLAF